MNDSIFAPAAKWIWDGGDPLGYNEYVRFRRDFSLGEKDAATIRLHGAAALKITADALYQVWLNGHPLGHGPAKSAEGKRSVDGYEIDGLLRAGENRLEALVLSIGTGTMTYCLGEAGLIFQIETAGKKIVSDGSTLAQSDWQRTRRTVRRWMLPCLEDVDAAAKERGWKPARVIPKNAKLYRRRVPLPAREPLVAQRLVACENVTLPNFSVSLRLKPYLVKGDQQRRTNTIAAPAYLVTDIVSPVAQEMEFVPALGNVIWFFNGRRLFEGSGWTGWDPAQARPVIRLKKGANRLVGAHDKSHFEDINLCAFVKAPVEAVNPFGQGAFQVFPADRAPRRLLSDPSAPTGGEAVNTEDVDVSKLDWTKMPCPEMNSAHTMIGGNAQDLARNARPVRELATEWEPNALNLPAAKPGEAARVIVDLGVLHNGWLAFEASGPAGSRLIFSFFEALDEGPPHRIQWPTGCNNALTYRLPGGRQSFESFLTYGVRYIAIYYDGAKPARIENLRVLTANCTTGRRGYFLSPDPLLNGIYEIAAQSAASATDDTFTDCPTYEQVNWNFDNRIAALTDFLTSANAAVTRNSIELFTEDPCYQGLVRGQYPSTWDNRIPLWSFHWILFCRDYYWHTADADFVKKVYRQIAAGIEEGLGLIGKKGLLEWSGGQDVWHMVEWGHGRDDVHAIVGGEQAGFLGALEAAEFLGQVTGADPAQIKRWGAARRDLLRAVRREMFDESRDAFVDSIHADGSRSSVSSQATNAILALHGTGDRAWRQRLVRRLAKDDPALLPYGSPVGAYYILELLDQAGEVEAIFRIIKRRWGDMVLAGDTTTWEQFAEFGHAGWPTRSRCHPYSSYVVKYFVKYLLGIEPLAPGFARVRVRPRPPAGIDRCHGAIPTPRGVLRVAWERTGGKIRARVSGPVPS